MVIMNLLVFKSKIHRATVTDADLHYEGSVTISRDLMKKANFLPFEQVHIWNVTNGNRLITYVLEGEENTGTICINGAGAHLMHKGDIVIIGSFASMTQEEAASYNPTVVFVDENNKPKN